MDFQFYPYPYQPVIYYYFPYTQDTHQYQIQQAALESQRQIRNYQSVPLTQEEIKTPTGQKISETSDKIVRPIKKKSKTKSLRKKDSTFSGKSQKQNRNYTSIICRLYLMYLAKHPSIDILIRPLLQKYNLSLNAQSFHNTFHNIFDISKTYIRKELVQSVCQQNIADKQFSLVFRTLFNNFLRLQIFPTVFRSNKLSKKVKVKEVKFAKKVHQMFFRPKRNDQTHYDISNESNKKYHNQYNSLN